MTPKNAIKLRCRDCQPGNKSNELCIGCALKNDSLTNLKKIKKYCEWCNGQIIEVLLCPDKSCSLYQYRLGKNPARSGIGNKNANVQKNIKKRKNINLPRVG